MFIAFSLPPPSIFVCIYTWFIQWYCANVRCQEKVHRSCTCTLPTRCEEDLRIFNTYRKQHLHIWITAILYLNNSMQELLWACWFKARLNDASMIIVFYIHELGCSPQTNFENYCMLFSTFCLAIYVYEKSLICTTTHETKQFQVQLNVEW